MLVIYIKQRFAQFHGIHTGRDLSEVEVINDREMRRPINPTNPASAITSIIDRDCVAFTCPANAVSLTRATYRRHNHLRGFARVSVRSYTYAIVH